MADQNGAGSSGGMIWTPQLLLDIGTRLGVPFVVLLLVLTQLGPKIDRGIAIADHVDAEMQYLALRGCAPLGVPVTPP